MQTISRIIRVLTALITSACFAGFYIWYGLSIAEGPEVVEPLLFQWLCFALATSLTLYSWMRTAGEGSDWLGNCQNVMDIILYVVPAMAIYYGNYSLELNAVTVATAIGVVSILIYLLKTGDGRNSHNGAQFIISFGFLPLYGGLLLEGVHTEAIGPWALVWVGTFFGLYPPFSGTELQPKIYAARSFSMVTLLMGMIGCAEAGYVWVVRLIFALAVILAWRLLEVTELLDDALGRLVLGECDMQPRPWAYYSED